MSMAALVIAFAAIPCFLLLPMRWKALCAFAFMTQLFDVGPNLILGYYAWDFGAAMMFVTGLQAWSSTPVQRPAPRAYLLVLWALIAWIVVCFAWSLLVYQYPAGHTFKAARRMLLGYPMVFVLLRVFAVDPSALGFLLKWIYRITFVLMPVVILQFLLQKQLLNGLFREHEGTLRAVPVFLPLVVLCSWQVLARLLGGERVPLHERLYLLLASVVVALSFTRGVYVAVLLVGLVMLATLARERVLKAGSVARLALLALPLVAIFLATGTGQLVVRRVVNALQLVGSGAPASATEREASDDSFHGRLGLAGERFALSMERNPAIGFGFIHEDDVPDTVRAGLKYGTVLTGTATDPEAFTRRYAFSRNYVLALYSADIAWADVVVATGLGGVILLTLMVAALVFDYFRDHGRAHPLGPAWRLAFVLETIFLFVLMLDGDNFFATVHVPALMLAAYSLGGPASQVLAAEDYSAASAPPHANLMA